MSSLEADSEGIASAHGRPCVSCRKRKVKCDKTRPCSNCSRSKQLCTYESSNAGTISPRVGSHGGTAMTDGDIRERLARLEALMAKVIVGDSARETATGSPQNSGGSLYGHELARKSSSPPTQTPPEQQYQSSVPSQSTNRSTSSPVGQILFQNGSSAYFDSEFWPELIIEVEELKRLFDNTSSINSVSTWASPSLIGLQSPSPMTDISLTHPTIEESNLLCKLFFESVNPFVHVIHQELFARELDRFRRGTFFLPLEFEALLFSIYTLTVNSLRADIVESTFSVSKNDLLIRFQQGTQLALSKVNFFKTDKIITMQAVLHYLTFLFQQNLYQDARALLSVAVRCAQTMGFHRDPSQFPFSPWVWEIRTRIWNQLCCLDALALTSFGTESCLPPTADAPPPRNANDVDWQPSRYAKPSSVPPDTGGFKEMTFVLVNRIIADLTRQIARLDTRDFKGKEQLIRHTETSLNEKYLKGIDRSNSSQAIIIALVEIKMSSLRLSIRHRQAAQSSDADKYQCFIAAIELLEAFEYHSLTFASFNWEWVFQTIIPWLAIAIVLKQLPHATTRADIQRAQKEIDSIFNRHSYSLNPLTSTPMWQLLVQLRLQTQNQLDHQQSEQSTSRPSMASHTGESNSSLPTSGFTFNDDLMQDFLTSANLSEPMIYDDQLVPDVQTLPWLNSQMPF